MMSRKSQTESQPIASHLIGCCDGQDKKNPGRDQVTGVGRPSTADISQDLDDLVGVAVFHPGHNRRVAPLEESTGRVDSGCAESVSNQRVDGFAGILILDDRDH